MTREGKNDAGTIGYVGPCPVSGTHRYFFKVYALDTTLHLEKSATRAEVEQAMKDHVMTQTELVGRYARA